MTPGDVQQGVATASNADLLYAKAIAALNLNPAIVEALSPAARSLYDVAYNVVRGAIGAEISTLGDAALGAATEALGPEVVAQLGNIAEQIGAAVADAVPIINIMMGIYNVISGIQSAADAPLIARVNNFLAVGTIQGSGDDGTITGADLFAPSHEANHEDPMWGLYVDRPRSSLGAVLAAVTEDNDTEAPLSSFPTSPGFDPAFQAKLAAALAALGIPLIPPAEPYRWPGHDPFRIQALLADTNLHHSSIIWDLAANAAWPGKDHSGSTDFSGPADSNARIGIPKSRRMVYQALRRAMGARGKDRGATLLPIYLDMLAEDFDAGALTPSFVNQLLSWVYTDNSDLGPAAYGLEEVAGVSTAELIDRPGVIGLNRQQRADFTAAILAFVDAWRQKRQSIATSIGPHLKRPIRIKIKRPRLTLTPLHLAGLLKVPSSSKKTAAEQAAIDAYAAALGLPPGHY